MFNDEIFIIGKPPILLHSKDSGKSWERVPLSPKVSGLLLIVVSTVGSSILFWSVADTGRVNFVRWDTLSYPLHATWYVSLGTNSQGEGESGMDNRRW